MIPYTDYECRLKLDELYEGRSVVIPKDMEHARAMIRVAQWYIDEHHKDLINMIKYSDADK